MLDNMNFPCMKNKWTYKVNHTVFLLCFQLIKTLEFPNFDILGG